jgi:hypothetical protein
MWGLGLPIAAKRFGSRSRGKPALIMIWGGSLFVQGDRKQYSHYSPNIFVWQKIMCALD